MITLFLMISLLNATPQDDQISCTFLDQYMDFVLTDTTQPLVNDDETLYLEIAPVEFLPDDIESTCDFKR